MSKAKVESSQRDYSKYLNGSLIRPMNHLEALGLPLDFFTTNSEPAIQSHLRITYLTLARTYHSDKLPLFFKGQGFSKEEFTRSLDEAKIKSDEIFKRIQSAYEVMKDPVLRELYLQSSESAPTVVATAEEPARAEPSAARAEESSLERAKRILREAGLVYPQTLAREDAFLLAKTTNRAILRESIREAGKIALTLPNGGNHLLDEVILSEPSAFLTEQSSLETIYRMTNFMVHRPLPPEETPSDSGPRAGGR